VADYKYSLRGLARDSEDYQFKLSEVKSISLSLLQLFELHKTTITFLGYMVLQFKPAGNYFFAPVDVRFQNG
jgi:hypothetical protein